MPASSELSAIAEGALYGEAFKRYAEQVGADFIDFGCSKGGSLKFAMQQLGGVCGIGIDISPAKVAATKDAGFHAVLSDINSLPDAEFVKFTVLSHFLEHVSDKRDVRDFVAKACAISSDFVFIQQPFFDADDYLARRGLKLYWSDWKAHPNRMTSTEMRELLQDLKAEGRLAAFEIFASSKIKNSESAFLHALASPANQHFFDPSIHPPKPKTIEFQSNVYTELICLIVRKPRLRLQFWNKFRKRRRLKRLNRDLFGLAKLVASLTPPRV